MLTMYFGDHNPPHFHARYGEHEALIAVDGFGVLRGYLPTAKLSLVTEWASQSQALLRAKWAEVQEEG